MFKLVHVMGCLLLLVVAGCGSKLDYETSLKLAPGEERTLTIDPTPKEQKVRVQVKSTGGAVTVDCFLEKDQQEVEKARRAGKKSEKALASEEKKEEAELQVTVPAQAKAVVLFTAASAKTVDVKVKISNR